jgi:hypothetical protein
VERKENDIKCRRTSVKKDSEKTDTKRENNSLGFFEFFE